MEKGSRSLQLFGSLAQHEEEKEKEMQEEEKGRPLTFFYGGKVYSFHNISPLQVGAILCAAEQELKEASPPPPVDLVQDERGETKKGTFPIAVVQQQPHLPLVNKASLARFLANRRRKQRVKNLDNTKVGPTASSTCEDDDPVSKKPRHTTATTVLQLFPL